MVCLARLERALNALSTRSLCQLGYRHTEDQAGFEPAVGLSQRIKSPPRSAATVTGPWSGGREWLRSTGRRVKSPLPLHLGLRLRVQIWCKREVLPLLPRGYRPRPSLLGLACMFAVLWCSLTDSNRRMPGCRPDAFAAWRREHVAGAPRGTRTCNMSLLRRPPLPNWATGAYPRQASNLHFPAFKAGPLPVGLRG